MINFPEFKTTCQFNEPIFFSRQYVFKDEPSYYYKAKGYTEKGLVYGTVITNIPEEDFISISRFTLEPERFTDYKMGTYSPITEEEYQTAFANILTFDLE